MKIFFCYKPWIIHRFEGVFREATVPGMTRAAWGRALLDSTETNGLLLLLIIPRPYPFA